MKYYAQIISYMPSFNVFRFLGECYEDAIKEYQKLDSVKGFDIQFIDENQYQARKESR